MNEIAGKTSELDEAALPNDADVVFYSLSFNGGNVVWNACGSGHSYFWFLIHLLQEVEDFLCLLENLSKHRIWSPPSSYGKCGH